MTPEPRPELVTTCTTDSFNALSTCGNVGVGIGVGIGVAVGTGVAVGWGVGIAVETGMAVAVGDGIAVAVGSTAVGDGSTNSGSAASLPQAIAATIRIAIGTTRKFIDMSRTPYVLTRDEHRAP
jgi:hypothetical protein